MIDLLETLFNLLPTWTIAVGLYLIACIGIWRLVCNQNKGTFDYDADDSLEAFESLRRSDD